jgi:hypothetical protein
MYQFSTNDGPDSAEVRERLRKITDEQLLEFGKAANFMCSARANMNRPPRETFVIQLEEARSE